VAVAAAAAPAGCASPDYGGYLNRWVGASTPTLVAAWGEPTWRNLAADGSDELHYVYEEPTLELVSSARADHNVDRCHTVFRAGPQGVIRGWRYAGNFCVPRSR